MHLDLKDQHADLALERPSSLADRVCDMLVEAISLGRLRSGERIVEADIARRFQVSRVPVREAFKILTTHGILEGATHRGVWVANFDEPAFERICEARLAVEAMALRALLAEPDRREQLDMSLEREIQAMAQAVARKDPIGVNRADLAFHSAVCRQSGHAIAFTLWQAIARHVRIVFGREILSETSLSAIVNQHQDLRRVIMTGAVDVAAAALQDHVLRLRRRQAGATGKA